MLPALTSALTLALAASLLLAGCGQRGPLFIPGKPGDPEFDRQQRSNPPTGAGQRSSGQTTPQTTPPQTPQAPDSNRPRRDNQS